MLKYYLDCPGKIPTSVHPFVKQKELKKVQLQPETEEIKFFERLRTVLFRVGRSLLR